MKEDCLSLLTDTPASQGYVLGVLLADQDLGE